MNKALINYRPPLGIEVLQDRCRPELGLFQNIKINGKQPSGRQLISYASSSSKLACNSTNVQSQAHTNNSPGRSGLLSPSRILNGSCININRLSAMSQKHLYKEGSELSPSASTGGIYHPFNNQNQEQNYLSQQQVKNREWLLNDAKKKANKANQRSSSSFNTSLRKLNASSRALSGRFKNIEPSSPQEQQLNSFSNNRKASRKSKSKLKEDFSEVQKNVLQELLDARHGKKSTEQYRAQTAGKRRKQGNYLNMSNFGHSSFEVAAKGRELYIGDLHPD